MLHKRPNMYKFLNVEDTYILDTDTDNRKQKLGIEKKYRCAAYSTLSVRGAALHLCWVVLRHAHQWSTGDAVRQLPQHVSTPYSYPLVLRDLILCYAFTEYTTSQTLVSSVVQC